MVVTCRLLAASSESKNVLQLQVVFDPSLTPQTWGPDHRRSLYGSFLTVRCKILGSGPLKQCQNCVQFVKILYRQLPLCTKCANCVQNVQKSKTTGIAMMGPSKKVKNRSKTAQNGQFVSLGGSSSEQKV